MFYNWPGCDDIGLGTTCVPVDFLFLFYFIFFFPRIVLGCLWICVSYIISNVLHVLIPPGKPSLDLYMYMYQDHVKQHMHGEAAMVA